MVTPVRPDSAVAHNDAAPSAEDRDDPGDQRRLAVGAARVLTLLAPPTVGVAAAVAGWPGAIGALVGLGFVLVLFGASALLLSWVSARALAASGVMILVVGSVVRLALYFVVLLGLSRVDWVHGRSLGAATALAIAVTLAYELRLLSRMQRLFWVDAGAGRPSATANDTRSQPL